jgi:hypothetical protein
MKINENPRFLKTGKPILDILKMSISENRNFKNRKSRVFSL